MNTHYRWLRMMVTLIVDEMERVDGPPASGYPLLMILDEFAALRRMKVIENAAAQIAGFGVRMAFIVQTLAQLKDTYRDNWETLVANAGTKIFFANDDHFTRDYVSKLVGEVETVREQRSSNQSINAAKTTGTSSSTTMSWNSSYSHTTTSNPMQSSSTQAHSFGISESQGRSSSETEGRSYGEGSSESVQRRMLITPDEVGRMFGDPDKPAALVLISGRQPLYVKRSDYFRLKWMRGKYDAHKSHPKPLTLLQLDEVFREEQREEDAKEFERERTLERNRRYADELVARAKVEEQEEEARREQARKQREDERRARLRRRKVIAIAMKGCVYVAILMWMAAHPYRVRYMIWQFQVWIGS